MQPSQHRRRSSQPATSPPPTTKQYPTASSSSSAFSASANPDEDWTKISDLAERRRIQNRIAQRNYRKKLKKRLEDLERRAESSSASPEQRHQELDHHDAESSESHAQDHPQSYGHPSYPESMSSAMAPNYMVSTDDRGMFSQQNLRPVSVSPPPFSSAPYSAYQPAMAPGFGTSAYSQCMGSPYLPPPQQQPYADNIPYQAIGLPAIKQEYYAEDGLSPYNMSYAPITNGEYPRQTVTGEAGFASSGDAYTTMSPPTNPNFDFYEHSSPPDLVWLPATPPLSSCGESHECHDDENDERRLSAFIW